MCMRTVPKYVGGQQQAYLVPSPRISQVVRQPNSRCACDSIGHGSLQNARRSRGGSSDGAPTRGTAAWSFDLGS